MIQNKYHHLRNSPQHGNYTQNQYTRVANHKQNQHRQHYNDNETNFSRQHDSYHNEQHLNQVNKHYRPIFRSNQQNNWNENQNNWN